MCACVFFDSFSDHCLRSSGNHQVLPHALRTGVDEKHEWQDSWLSEQLMKMARRGFKKKKKMNSSLFFYFFGKARRTMRNSDMSGGRWKIKNKSHPPTATPVRRPSLSFSRVRGVNKEKRCSTVDSRDQASSVKLKLQDINTTPSAPPDWICAKKCVFILNWIVFQRTKNCIINDVVISTWKMNLKMMCMHVKFIKNLIKC